MASLRSLCQSWLFAHSTTSALIWCLEGITYADYKQPAVRLQLTIKWDSSFSTPVLEQIWTVRMFGESGVDSYFFSWKKSFWNKLKRMSLDRTHWDIVGSQWPTSASNIFQCLLPWMCHCATLTDKPLLPQTSSSSSTGISLTLLRLKEKSDLALKEKFATSPLENLHFYCSLKENRFQTCRCLFCLAPCMCANQLFLWWTSTNQVTDHDWLINICPLYCTSQHQTPWLWCHS